MPDLLLEIGVEEIPDWMIGGALAELRARFEKVMEENALGGAVHLMQATPRRLVLRAQNLIAQQADAEELMTGPPKSAGAGAAQGFAKKMGTTADALNTIVTEKGEYLSFVKQRKGRATIDILAGALADVIAGISFPKTMYWTGKGGVRFIRPIRWILALLGDQVIPLEIANVKSGNRTRGHRILGAKDPLAVTIDSYEETLTQNGVVVEASDRRRRIEDGLGPNIQQDAALLETLVYLTEFPTPIRGSFDPAYLELPKEILSTVMRHHQRYFTVLKPDGSLAPEFVAVTNTDGDPDGLIRQGNERVLRARFNDARFFWKVDQQRRLAERVEDLAKVTFQAKRGSYKEKTERVRRLANQLAQAAGADQNTVDVAALLCKCDLTTEMVKEFTELQGVVGGLYAKAQGETEAVATAIYDHYKPVSMEDSIPRTKEGQIVAVADKLDTLQQCFAIGLIPTSSKDPFALRRAAQGIVKILFEARLPLDLGAQINDVAQLEEFFRERVAYYLREVKGYAYDEVNAVLGGRIDQLNDVNDRLLALSQVRKTPDFEALAASFKRVKNIIKQAGLSEIGQVDPDLLATGPEQELYQHFSSVLADLEQTPTYAQKLVRISTLRPHVDLFFDKILVNDPNPAIRKNRLALLQSLLTEFSNIADFSEIVTAGDHNSK